MYLKLGKYTINETYLQLLISGILLITYSYMGSMGKFIVFPYVVYLVLRNDIQLYPALVLQLLTENFTLYIILISYLILIIVHNREIIQTEFKVLFIGYLLLMVYIIFHFLYRYFTSSTDILILIANYSIFLNLSPFFAGIVYRKNLNRANYNDCLTAIVLILITGLIIHARLLFYAIPFLFLYSAVQLFKNNNRSASGLILFVLFSGVLLFALIKMDTFTIILTVFVSLVVYLSYTNNYQVLLKFFSSALPFVFTILFMISVSLAFGDKRTNSDTLNQEITLNNFFERGMAKLIDDRVPYWVAATKSIIEEENIFIPVVIKIFEAETETGGFMEVSFGAHTLYIEFIRVYGLIPGIYLLTLYILIFVKSTRRLFSQKMERLHLMFLAVSLSVSSIGAMGGTYPLGLGFALLNMGVVGFIYTYYNQKVNV